VVLLVGEHFNPYLKEERKMDSKKSRMIIILTFILTLSLQFNASEIFAEDYPTKPIKMIVPWGPGSTTLTARVFNNYFTKYSPQPLVVVSKPGSSGVIGTRELKKSRPDGYTLLWEAIAVVAVQPHLRDTGYTLDDFEYIINVHKLPLVLFVPASSPYKTLKDFIEGAKANPGKVSVSSAAFGTMLHLAIADLALKENLKINYVPMEGSKITISVIGGHVDAGVHQPPIVAPYVESGKVRILCTFSKKRLHWFPDIPTATELGYAIEQEVWNFIVAPKGTPKDRINWVHDAVKKTLEDKGFNGIAEKLKIDIDYRSGEQTYKDVVKASKRYKEIVNDLGLAKKK
jgi:tripartite-type tricarboxylate transporter receptor subunit TctC